MTRKGRVDENATELDASNDEGGKYEVEAIRDNAVYAKESVGHLPGLYYLVFWKEYLEEENTWEHLLAIQHLRKLISSFYKDHSNKPTATPPAINSVPLMARPTVTARTKQKQERPANSSNKQTKKN